MAFPSPPKPVSLLGRHRILSPTAGVRVSPLCLGAMNFGDAWKEVLGECNKETSFAMLDKFYSQGGNCKSFFQSSQSDLGWMDGNSPEQSSTRQSTTSLARVSNGSASGWNLAAYAMRL